MDIRDKILDKYKKDDFSKFTKWLFLKTRKSDVYYDVYAELIDDASFGDKTADVETIVTGYYSEFYNIVSDMVTAYNDGDKYEEIQLREKYLNLLEIEEQVMDEIDAGLISMQLAKMERGSQELQDSLEDIIERFVENEHFYNVLAPYKDDIDNMYKDVEDLFNMSDSDDGLDDDYDDGDDFSDDDDDEE